MHSACWRLCWREKRTYLLTHLLFIHVCLLPCGHSTRTTIATESNISVFLLLPVSLSSTIQNTETITICLVRYVPSFQLPDLHNVLIFVLFITFPSLNNQSMARTATTCTPHLSLNQFIIIILMNGRKQELLWESTLYLVVSL